MPYHVYMNITVFGASGHVGQLVVAELVKRGHTVTAFVHGRIPFEKSKQITVITGDVHSKKDVELALKNADAVISTLGSWGTKTKDIVSSAMTNIIPVMEHHNIKRIVTLTGAAIMIDGDKKDVLQSLAHVSFGIVAGKILRDGEDHIKQLQKTDLAWTTLRSPVMDDQNISSYLLNATPPKPWEKISRKAITKAIVDLIESEMFVQRAPFIH